MPPTDTQDVPNNFDNLPDTGSSGGPTTGGFTAQHQRIEHLLQVGPTTDTQKNTFRPAIFPIACWRIDDVRFNFDSSVILTDAVPEFQALKSLMAANPGAPLSVFGHADPTGTDDYNKYLSGRRAQAVYGALTRNTDLWEDIYSSNQGGDVWDTKTIEAMRTAAGLGELDNNKDHRVTIFNAYMDVLCGADFKADKGAFLAQGADDKGKGDYQGCSEFNPVMMFSHDENTSYQPQSMHAKRDQENGINRRVMIFLFRPGSVVDSGKWPCPRVKESIAGCKKRFWSDAATRRTFQTARRNYADTRDTFACRFYDRLSSGSPCEGGSIPPLPNLRIYLKLTWKDPEANVRPFPPDFPVIVRSPASEQSVTVIAGGFIAFDFNRAEKAFTLRFEHADNYIASSSPSTQDARPERYLAASDVDAAVKDGYRVWRLPKKWSLLQSDWKANDPTYNTTEARFEGLQPFSVFVGADGSPVECQLDPHWNFVRFEFCDRYFGTPDTGRFGVPPMMLDGFRTAPTSKGAAPDADTRSNWAVYQADNAKGAQALPWVLQRKLDKSPDVKPDAAILLQLVIPKGTFVVSQDATTRALEVITDKNRLAPSADRLKLYDLPELWKSTKYYTRGAGNNSWFDKVTNAEVLAANDSSQPLVFSLDDMVLTDASLNQAAVAGDQLALVFFHQFKQPSSGGANLSPEGVYKIGGDATKDFFPYTDIAMPVKYYVHDYPDWTRLVIVNGNMYEAFDQRTADNGANEVVGARAAVNWVDSVAKGKAPGNQVNPRPSIATQSFFSIQPFFSQDIHPARSKCLSKGTYKEWASPVPSYSGFFYGRFDMTMLRCCDYDGDNEVALNLHYFRFFLDFSNAPTDRGDSAKTPFDRNAFKKAMLTNIPTRWNGPDTVTLSNGGSVQANPGDFLIKPQAAGALKFEARPFFYTQATPLARAHFQLNILPKNKGRANMGSDKGIGEFMPDNEAPDPNSGWFTAAHETGHGDGLPDEYNERWSAGACSYAFPGFGSQLPGDPYSIVRDALMMEGVLLIEGRYFWYGTEWMRTILNTPLQIESQGHKFFLPPHPSAPARTFVHFPGYIEMRASGGTRGQFDMALYALGDDPYRSRIKGGVPYDGLLVVIVKIRVHFDSVSKYTDVTGPLDNLRSQVDNMMNRRFVFAGSLGPFTFTNALVQFAPRLLVETLTNDGTNGNNQYLQGLGYNPPSSAKQGDYNGKVSAVESDHPKHFQLRVVTSGTRGWTGAAELHLTSADLNSAGVWKWFADMVGIDCSLAAAPTTVLTNAAVQSTIVQRAVPGATVSTSA